MSAVDDPVGPAIVDAAPDTLADKAELPWGRMALLSVLAGVFIAFGSIAFLVVQAVPGGPAGPQQMLSGVVFSVGLLLVLVTGAELFTGNTMFALPAARGRLAVPRLAGSWTVVWTGNLIGSLIVAGLFAAAGGAGGVDGEVGAAAIRVTEEKLGMGAGAVLASGVLANMLVCLAVWMAMGARTIPAKALAVVGPIAVFVAAGFEHSIANMSLLPIGLMAGAAGDTGGVALNLVLSTVGNIVGGAGIALAIAYGHGGGSDD